MNANGWISVEERSAPVLKDVLISVRGPNGCRNTLIASREAEEKRWQYNNFYVDANQTDDEAVTHWQPLPGDP